MKKIILIIASLVIGTITSAQDKKDLKTISKNHNEFSQGNVFGKGEKIAILGSNLRFRLASRATATTSRKDATTSKFESFASLKGVTPELLQEITNEYHKMVEDRFKKFGLTIIPYSQIESSKGYSDIIEKRVKTRENVRPNWGVAQIFTNDENEYVDWKQMSPVGPHVKLAKSLKSILHTSLVTIDFCFIDVDASSTRSGSGNYQSIYVEGNSKVIPAINIHGYTYGLDGVKIMEDNTYSLNVNDAGKIFNALLNYSGHYITSEIDYAEKVEKCAGCEPEFASKRFKLMSNGLGTVEITANPILYKKAVLDALDKYLDEVFTLYSTQK